MKDIYKNSSYPIEKRVEDLMLQMTLDEKIAQLCGNLPYNIIENGQINKERLKEIGHNGLGRLTQYSLVGLVSRNDIARISNELQDYFVSETRLGIPVALQSENLVGYPGEGGTLFPGMTNLAATWDEKLAYQMSSIIGQESHAVGINSAMSPVIDVSRDPRWGRTYETFGEDQYLISQMGTSYIKGMQEQGVSAIAKHFLGYSETQGGLNLATERLNDRELYEVFATPFEAAIKDADLDAIMASYAEIDGLPIGANPKVTRRLLRNTMGFKGMLISDGAAIWKMYDYFKIARSYSEAGLIAKKGGLDSEIPVGNAFGMLGKYVREGQLDIKYIDESVRRVLTIKFKRGLFEDPYVKVDNLAVSMTNSKKQEVSHMIASESIVLLKNADQLLPLDKGQKISVIGPHADSIRYPVSGYSYPAYLEMINASENRDDAKVSFNGMIDEKNKNKTPESSGYGFISGMFSHPEEINVAKVSTIIRNVGGISLREALAKQFEVQYEQGCDITDKDESHFDEAVAVAEESDVIIATFGGNSGWVNVTGGEGKDRSGLGLPGVQQKLLERLVSTGKPVVLVLFGPGIFALPWAKEHVGAILQSWLPGPLGGQVLADIISGKQNPEGKLPVTIPRSVGQVPCFYNHKVGSGYSDAIDHETDDVIFTGGYVDEDFRPLFEFGYGMSYSTFKISDFTLKENRLSTTDLIKCECTVVNISNVTGAEVVQLYYHFLDAHVVRPNKQLIAYKKVRLAPHEKKRVKFEVKINQLGFYNENMDFVVEPGQALIAIGDSSEKIVDTAEIYIEGKAITVLGKRSYRNMPKIEDI